MNLFVPPSKTPSLPTEGNYRKHDLCVGCPAPIPSHYTAVRAFSWRDSRLAWPEVVGRAPPTIKDPRASCCAFPSPQWSGEEQDDQVSLSSKWPKKNLTDTKTFNLRQLLPRPLPPLRPTLRFSPLSLTPLPLWSQLPQLSALPPLVLLPATLSSSLLR